MINAMFEHDGDDYDFNEMTMTTMRGFRIYTYELKLINNNLFRGQWSTREHCNRYEQIQHVCPDPVQLAYQEYIAEKLLLED